MDLNKRLHEIFFRFPDKFPLPFILDGATGTALMKLGMPSGACTEIYVTENPEKINQIQSTYGKSGSNAVLAPTFGANRSVMKRHYIDESRVDELNKALVAISKKSRCSCASCMDMASASSLLIGADLSPTGCFIEPYGDTPFETVVDIYKEQAKSLLEAGVDFFITETNISLAEARAAVIAIREVNHEMILNHEIVPNAEIPVFVTLTVDERGRTMSGDSLESAVITLGELGINAFGTNCSTGPEEMIKSLSSVIPYAAAMGIPVIAKPNSGVPHENEDGTQTFSLTADDMEKYIPQFFENGIFVLGGCCGTDEKYISMLRKYANAISLSEESMLRFTGNLPEIQKIAASNRELINMEEIDIDTVKFIVADDEFSDNLSECEDDFVCVDLGEDGADIFIENIAFITTPVIIRGKKSQVEKVRRVYNGKLGVIAYF